MKNKKIIIGILVFVTALVVCLYSYKHKSDDNIEPTTDSTSVVVDSASVVIDSNSVASDSIKK